MPDGNLTSEPKKSVLIYLTVSFTSNFPQLINYPCSAEATNGVSGVPPSGAVRQIKNLKSSKAPGPDGFLKADLSIDNQLTAARLSKIFQVSLQTGQLPLDWKTINVSPHHK